MMDKDTKPKKIALVGENPNDTTAVINLLNQKYKDKVEFLDDFLLRVNGAALDNPKLIHTIRIQYEEKKPDFVIVVRDLDDLITNKEQLKKRKETFKAIYNRVDKKAILLLNIFEIEALILADFEMFKGENDWEFDSQQAAFQVEPKEKLQSFPKSTYKESDCAKCLSKARIDIIAQNHPYFAAFLREFEYMIARNDWRSAPYS